jgi:hypothetical protein
VIARPKLKIGRRHDLRLHSAHVAADGDRILVSGRVIQQTVPSKPEACNRSRIRL